MAKRRRKNDEREQLLSQGYSECQSCGELVKPGSKRCIHCGSLMPTAKRIIAVIIIASMIAIASTLAYFLIFHNIDSSSLPCVLEHSPEGMAVAIGSEITVTFCRPMNIDLVEGAFYLSPAVAGDYSWLNDTILIFTPLYPLVKGETYVVTVDERAKSAEGRGLDSSIFRWYFTTEGGAPPNGGSTRRGVGIGTNDFWTVYPSSHPSAEQTVSHPSWAVTSLDQGVVMILDHSEGCSPCIQQMAICESLHSSYPQVQYLDLTSKKTEPQSSDAFKAYDPTGGINYIPLTILLTKVRNQAGEIVIGWHSWEGVVDSQTLTSWINDALSYYGENT